MKRPTKKLVRSMFCVASVGSSMLATNCTLVEDLSGALGVCIEGVVDCVDTVVDDGGDAAGGTCPEGTPDCIDADLGNEP